MSRLEQRETGGIVDLLVEHELLAAEFYAALADNCEKHRAFWDHMADAERGHAQLCEQLGADLCAQRATFVSGVFDRDMLSKAGTALARMIETVRTDRPSCLHAFARALGLERGIIEQGFFDVAADDNDTIAEFKKAMRDSLVTHRRRVQHEFDRLVSG